MHTSLLPADELPTAAYDMLPVLNSELSTYAPFSIVEFKHQNRLL
jgi:hypothetical protein